MLIKVISYIPSIIGLLTIGLFVLLNNSRNLRNRVFALLNLTTALWLFFLFLADTTTNEAVALWSLRLGLFFGEFIFPFFYIFALVFPRGNKPSLLRYYLVPLPIVVVAFLLLTPLGVASVSIQDFGVQPEEVGPLYTFSDLLGIGYLLLGAAILVTKLRRVEPREKNQIKFVLLGLSIAASVNIITGLVLTSLKIETDAILLGGFSLLIFSLFVAYAIIRHGLFDIRSVVARSAAYVLSLGSVAAMTLLFVYGLSGIAEANDISKNLQQLLNALIVISLAIIYQPLKRFFDKVTNKIFYRDAYDSQEMLNELNKSLVTTIALEEILNKSALVITNTIKAEYADFAIRNNQEHSFMLFGSKHGNLDSSTVQQIGLAISHLKEKVIVISDLEASKSHLRNLMNEHKISAVVKLEGKVAGRVQHPGYILLGVKRSGGLYSPQDMQILGIIADELVIAIQNSLRFEEIQRFNVTLQQKIDEATRELRRVNHRLRELDKTKDEFISMASHQLRTPLTAVKGYLSMVLDGDTGTVKKNQKEMISKAFDGAQKMVYLIADMLNVSRLQTGKFVIENTQTNLADLVEGEVSQLQETAAGKQLKLLYHKPDKFPTLNLDETKIRQVVMNFADNAIYYTPAGGTVTVELTSTDKEVQFTVSDTGIGIPASVQHHLFSKFYRADNARKMRPDGTGLGLFMAKKVIAAQGGALIFKSTEGKGSTFGFSFPRHSMEVKEARVAAVKT